MTEKKKSWHAVDITVAAHAVEAAELALDLLDTLGTEIDQLRKKDAETITVTGFFEDNPDLDDLRAILGDGLRNLGFESADLLSVDLREVENTDWLAEWKRHWKPTKIGGFVIAPPWSEVVETDKLVIRIEPNMAFGTGTHETTQLCLRAISDIYDSRQSVLDVGTGTGVLAIAAAKMQQATGRDGPQNIVACDTDLDSVRIARENAALNDVAEAIEFFDGPIGDATPAFDFVCANLTIDVIVPILPLLLAKSRRTLLLSGILSVQTEMITAELLKSQISNFKLETAGEWISVVVDTFNRR